MMMLKSVDYQSRSNQVCDDELGIGTSTRLLLCGELEDTVCGTAIEKQLVPSLEVSPNAVESMVLTIFL